MVKYFIFYPVLIGLFFISFSGYSKILLMGGTYNELLQLEDYFGVKNPQKNIDTVNNNDLYARFNANMTDKKEMEQIKDSYSVIYYSNIPFIVGKNSLDLVIPKLKKDGVLIYIGPKLDDMKSELSNRGFQIIPPDAMPLSLLPILTEEEHNKIMSQLDIKGVPADKIKFIAATKLHGKTMQEFLNENENLQELLKRSNKYTVSCFLLDLSYAWQPPLVGQNIEEAKEEISSFVNDMKRTVIYPCAHCNIVNPERSVRQVKNFLKSLLDQLILLSG